MSITQSTRQESYKVILETLGQRQAAVYHELELLGDTGATAGELALIMHEKEYFPKPERNFVHPRLTELHLAGVVEVCGKRKCGVTGRTCGIYRVALDDGEQAYYAEPAPESEQLTLF
ncbi:hypothetical protein SAMN02799624_05386 [Paenibacillus sp. UNC496MF]|uniref:hypothetical protein n=1 Tax=Paenibacillus sp. UNC496MF TaxID=1502753 RepID=UPI0008ECEFA5|nr:hypothetical protein [Paenibacillus sp. UNC496MF]SFJ65202.1 hypothetical protein SAMN02799624_05386 [Paenibacillus sp. UNC496MF]